MMSSTMKYYDYCRQQKIPHFPIRLWLKPTGETLSDGSVKIEKIIFAYQPDIGNHFT